MNVLPAGITFRDQYNSVLLRSRRVFAKADFSLGRLISPRATVKGVETEQPLWSRTESRTLIQLQRITFQSQVCRLQRGGCREPVALLG